MLDLKYVLGNLEEAARKTAARNYEFDFAKLAALDEKRKGLIARVEKLKADRNEISRRVGALKREGKDTSALQEKVKEDAALTQTLDAELNEIKATLDSLMLNIPNLIDDSVPLGKDETENVVIRTWGEPTKFDFEPKGHWDIGADLGIIDFERGVKVAKTRFSVLSGMGAKLDRAISAFMLDTHEKAGYKEVAVPFMVNPAAMTGTGQLPKFAEEAFYCEKDDLYLIPTAEVPVTNLYMNEILDAKTLPIKHAALSACFRREVGSYGKDVKGLIRQHQFNKVELVKVCEPEKSEEEHESLTADAENILKLLKLPYRVVSLSSGDLGFSSAKTYDLEVWLPGQNCYREISSCSNFKDFQARRANIRCRGADGKVRHAHTLNGSGLAVGRTLVAILENYQQKDGSVIVPDVLRPYMGGADRISRG